MAGESQDWEWAKSARSLGIQGQVDLAMSYLVSPLLERPESLRLHRAIANHMDSAESLLSAIRIFDVVADLKPSVARFGGQLQRVIEAGIDFPCVKGIQNMPTPIDPTSIPDFHPELFRPEESEGIPSFDLTDTSLVDVPPGQAWFYFESGLRRFVAARFSALKTGKGHPYSFAGGSPGFVFEVTSVSSGLTVYFTYQHYLNPVHVFGAPTTPVRGYMPAGLWHFGASTKQRAIRWDLNAVYDVPRVFKAHLSM